MSKSKELFQEERQKEEEARQEQIKRMQQGYYNLADKFNDILKSIDSITAERKVKK